VGDEADKVDEVQEIDAGIETPEQTLGDVVQGGVDFLKKYPTAVTSPFSAMQSRIPVTKKGDFFFADDPLSDAKPEAPSTGQVLLGGLGGGSPDPFDYSSQPGYDDLVKGKGEGGLAGSMSGTIGPGVPGEYKAASIAYQSQSAAYESLYHQARADAAGIMVNIQDELVQGYEDKYAPIMKEVDALLTEAEDEREGIRELIEKAKSNEINPGQFFANVGEAGKFSAAIAVGVGAMATAFGGGPNAAYQIISRAIDRNVRAQVVNQHHGRALIAHQMNFVNTIRGLAKDRAQYGNYVKLGLDAIAQAEVGKVRSALVETGAQLASQDVWARLGAKLVGDEITAITNSQARITFKFKNMAQARQGARVLGLGQQMKQAAGAAGKPKKTGRAPSQGQGTTPETRTSQLASQAIELGGSGEEISNRFIASHTRGTTPARPEERQELLNQLRARADKAKGTPDEAEFTAQHDEAARRSIKAFLNLPKEPIPYGTSGVAAMKVVDQKKWDKHWKDGTKVVSKALSRVTHLIELDDLLKGASIPVDAPILRDIGIMDGSVTLSTFFSPNEAERSAQISAITKKLLKRWHASTEEGTRNAMNLPWEKTLAEKGSSMGVSMAEYLADLVRSDPGGELRRARIKYQQESAVEDVRSTVANVGLWHEALQ